MTISTNNNLGFKSLQERCLENPDILEELMGYLDPKGLCALARVNKSINLVYKTLEDETLFPKSCEKRIKKIFIPFLFRYKTYQDLAIETYLKSERKSYLKTSNSRLGKIQKFVLSFFKSESSEISEFPSRILSNVNLFPLRAYLNGIRIPIVSKDFIVHTITESYFTCIKLITSFLDSLIRAEKLLTFKVVIEALQFNSDVLNDVCCRALQDNKALETVNNYYMMINSILINHSIFELFNRFPQINPVVLKKMFTATRDDSAWIEERHIRDLNREGIQKEWANLLFFEGVEILKKAYTDILYPESHDTKLENIRLVEELIKSHRSAEINPTVLERVCVIAVLNMDNNNTRLLGELIKYYGNTRSKIVLLEELIINLIQFKDNRIIDLLVGLDETNELITHCLNQALVWASIDNDSPNVKTILDSFQELGNDALGQALDWAAKKGHSEIIKMILNSPKITDINTEFLGKALISATENSHSKILELLAASNSFSKIDKYSKDLSLARAKEGYERLIAILTN